MPTLTLIALCLIVPFFLCMTLWPLLAFIMRGIKQARRDAVCKQPTIIRRTWFILILPMVLCQCQESYSASLAPTLWELPQHLAKLASEMPPEHLWFGIFIFILLDIGAHYILSAVENCKEWEIGFKEGLQSGQNTGFDEGFEEGTDFGRDQERSESFERGLKVGADLAKELIAPLYVLSADFANPENPSGRFKRAAEASFTAMEEQLHPERSATAESKA